MLFPHILLLHTILTKHLFNYNIFSLFNSFIAFFIAILIIKYKIVAGIAINIGNKIRFIGTKLLIQKLPSKNYITFIILNYWLSKSIILDIEIITKRNKIILYLSFNLSQFFNGTDTISIIDSNKNIIKHTPYYYCPFIFFSSILFKYFSSTASTNMPCSVVLSSILIIFNALCKSSSILIDILLILKMSLLSKITS